MATPIEVVFTYERDEYIRAMRRHYKTALSVKRDVIAGILAIALGFYFMIFLNIGWIAWLLIAVGTMLVLLVAYGIFLLPIWIYNSQPKLRNKYQITFADEGIGFKTDGIDSVLQWSIYHSWLCDNDFYIMYHGKRELSVIPRRVLPDAESERGLRQILENHIGPSTM